MCGAPWSRKWKTPAMQISLDAARQVSPKADIGDVVNIEVKTKNFGRIAAQTAKQVIIQGIREAERGIIFEQFTSKEHEILTGVVTRVEPKSGSVSIRLGSNSEMTEAMLSAGEQIKGEILTEGGPRQGLRSRGQKIDPRTPGAHIAHPPGSCQAPFRARGP